mmetsp:Transcript_39368/g.106511  ORF Transcript_39368/g.106511 Transcript_39368/m.106511 type:complete len:251 (-) Transcript_39368:149-901(-)
MDSQELPCSAGRGRSGRPLSLSALALLAGPLQPLRRLRTAPRHTPEGRRRPVRQRQWALHALLVEHEGHPLRVKYQLLHHGANAQALHVLLKALDSSRRNLRNLVGVVDARQAPAHLDARELGHEHPAGLIGTEVDETVANIARVLEVHGQIDEIELAAQVLVQLVHQHVPRVLVRDVPQHHRGEVDGLRGPAEAAAAAAAQFLVHPRLAALAALPPALAEGAAAALPLAERRGQVGGDLALRNCHWQGR